MDSRIRAELTRGGGLATTAALMAIGLTTQRIAALCRTGELVRVRRSVYTSGELWATWDPYVDRPLAAVHAAELTLDSPHVYSHDSGMLLLELPLLRPDLAEVHVSRLDLRGRRSRHGIHHHGARYRLGQVVTVGGLAALDMARTVVDMAREHGYRAGLVAADAALRTGVPRQELWAAAADMTGWPYSLTVKAVIADADGGAESVGETLARELAGEFLPGLPISTQFPVRIPRGVAWVDLRVGRHLIEFDGRVKYRSEAEGGLRDQDLEQLLWDERQRQHEVCGDGFGMTRLVYADYWGERRRLAGERLRREHAVTHARFGSELRAEQAEFEARMRGRRRAG